MARTQQAGDLMTLVRKPGIFVIVVDLVVAASDYLLIQYVDLSFLWGWLPSSSFASKLSTLLFFEGGILAAIGTFVGGGVAESQAAGSVASGGVTSGPELQGRLARERMQMREGQMGFGIRALLVGLSLVVISFLALLWA